MRYITFFVVILAAGTLQAAGQEEAVVFTDSNFEKIVQHHLQTDLPIRQEAILKLKYLCIRSAAISSLSGIEHARNLVSIRIYNSSVGDMRSLWQVSNLQELHIRNCDVGDLSAVSKLPSLRNLSLTDVDMQDLSFVANCSELSYLNVSNNRISRLSGLEGLKRLSRLDAYDNPVNDVSVASDTQQLRRQNPEVVIRHGSRPTIVGTSRLKFLQAKASMAEMGCLGKWEVIKGLARPLLPRISEEGLAAMTLLESVQDKEHLADVAAVLVRYADNIDRNYAPSSLMSRDNLHPLLKVLLTRMEADPLKYELTSAIVARWICENRKRFAPSIVLDEEIKKYLATQEFLRQKYLINPQ